ncbi:hypothetical protein GE09DRAFT_1168383 [Coniochaeta sp. 2T2.1]|nr:hypothetical protein GE09DRAFT_1168383 [Coniochaeta sp. 2T2.1]
MTSQELSSNLSILSHTWGPDDGEVTYGDLVDGTGGNKAGYGKIRFCAEQARRDGLQYFRVDTCCIGKSNNIELFEAINSMFGCQRSDLAWDSAFRASRWFCRGWALQELLAPASVEFFTKGCRRLGDKRSLDRAPFSGLRIWPLPARTLRNGAVSVLSSNKRDIAVWEIPRS